MLLVDQRNNKGHQILNSPVNWQPWADRPCTVLSAVRKVKRGDCRSSHFLIVPSPQQSRSLVLRATLKRVTCDLLCLKWMSLQSLQEAEFSLPVQVGWVEATQKEGYIWTISP